MNGVFLRIYMKYRDVSFFPHMILYFILITIRTKLTLQLINRCYMTHEIRACKEGKFVPVP
jgi:hypothetical protein